MIMAPEQVKQLLQEYRSALASDLGDRLRGVYLYGSHARGDARADSDVDVLCVVRGPVHYGELIALTSSSTAALSLKHDTTLSRAFVDETAWRTASTPFLVNARREGVAI